MAALAACLALESSVVESFVASPLPRAPLRCSLRTTRGRGEGFQNSERRGAMGLATRPDIDRRIGMERHERKIWTSKFPGDRLILATVPIDCRSSERPAPFPQRLPSVPGSPPCPCPCLERQPASSRFCSARYVAARTRSTSSGRPGSPDVSTAGSTSMVTCAGRQHGAPPSEHDGHVVGNPSRDG